MGGDGTDEGDGDRRPAARPDRTGETTLIGRTTIVATVLVLCVLAVAAVTLGGSVGASDPTLVADGDTTLVADGESIQDAINNSAPGDTIVVESGTYEEELLIDVDDLSIVAADGQRPVLEGDGSVKLDTAITIDGADGVVVGGLNVTNYRGDTAIVVQGSTDVRIADTTVVVESGLGMPNNGFGIYVTDSPNLVIEDTYVVDHDGEDGIVIDGSSGARLDNVTVRETGDGVHLTGSVDASIVDSTLVTNSHAVRVAEASDGTSIENTTVYDNRANDAVIISHSERVAIRSNNITDNSNRGIRFWQSQYGVVADNDVHGGFGSDQGITFDESSHHGFVANNSVTDHGDEGIRVQEADNITISDNLVDGNAHGGGGDEGGIHLTLSSDSTITGNEVRDNDVQGIFLDGEADTWGDYGPNANTIVEDNVVTGHDVDLDIVESVNTTVIGNEFESGVALDGTQLEDFDHAFADNTVDGDPVYFANGETAPEIPADAGQIIVVDSSDVEIREFELDGVAAGIQVAYSDGTAIEDNTLTEMGGSEDLTFSRGSITLWGSAESTVSENTISASDWKGLAIYDGADADVSDNEITSMELSGVFIDGSSGVTVSNNLVTDSAERKGVYVRDGSHGATIRENVLERNDQQGINVEDLSNALVANNTVRENADGINFDDVEDTLIVDNAVTDNQWEGIGTTTAQSGNVNLTVESNEVRGNGEGIDVSQHASEAVDHLTIVDNVVSDNDDVGIDALNARVVANDVSDNGGTGIEVTRDGQVEGNTVTGNDGHGISSDVGTVRNNTVSNNANDGIHVVEWSDGPITGNVVSGHAVDLRLVESTNATVLDNEFDAGIRIEESSLGGYNENFDKFDHEIANNTVDGKPLYHSFGAESVTVPSDVGQVIVVNAADVTIEEIEADGVATPIHVAYATDVTIEDTLVTDSPTEGIHLAVSENVTLDSSTVSRSADDGVYVEEVAPLHVVETAALENDGHGMSLELVDPAENSTVANNTVLGNDVGVELHVSGDLVDVVVRDNVIQDNGDGIVLDDDAEVVTISDNAIQGNDVGLRYDPFGTPPSLDATENWWGHESGPSGGVSDGCGEESADGSGDEIVAEHGTVCFAPWLTEPVGDEPFPAFAFAPEEPFEDEPVSFDAGDSVSPGGEIASYRWDFEGDGSFESTDVPEITYTYDEAGSYEVTLEVEDEWGTTARTSRSIEVEAIPGPTVSGTVSDADTGSSIADADVALVDESDAVVAQAVTDATGDYGLEAPEEGTYHLVINADGYEPGGVEGIELETDEETVVDVELDPIVLTLEIHSTTDPVTEGEPLEVEVQADYSGQGSHAETIELRDEDGTVLDDETIEFDDVGIQTIDLVWPTDDGDAGTHSLSVLGEQDSDATTVTVDAFTPATFEISVDSVNSPVTANETFEVDATVENVGDESGAETVELRDENDTVLANETVALDAGESESVTLEWETGPDDVGQYHFSVVTDDDAETVPVAVQEIDLGLVVTPSEPQLGETVLFYATDAENPTWDFGDGTTAQGSYVFHEYTAELGNIPYGTQTVTVTDVDGTEDSVDVTIPLPTIVWDPQPVASTSIDREYGGVPLTGVEWEETFTARMFSVDTVGAEAVDVEEFVFELGDETQTKLPQSDGLEQEASATFDLGELDGDEELTVTAVTADGGEWEMTEMVSVLETPEWLEEPLEDADVDRAAGAITATVSPDAVIEESTGIQELPIVYNTFGLASEPIMLFTYDTEAVAGTVHLDGDAGASFGPLVDTGSEGEWEVEVVLDPALTVESASFGNEGEIYDFPGPGASFEVPWVGEIGVETTIDATHLLEADLDGTLAVEDGTMGAGFTLSADAILDLYCGVSAGASGSVDGLGDFGEQAEGTNFRGEAALGAELGVFCGPLEWSDGPTFGPAEWGGGLDDALAFSIIDPAAFEQPTWEFTSKYGERPFADEDVTVSTAAGTEAADDVERLTERDLEDTQPAIVADGDDLVVVWSAQNETKNVNDGRDLHYQRYDSNVGEWSETQTLTDDETSDERPALAATEEGVLAVWSTWDEPVADSDISDPGDLFSRHEIAFAIDDGDGWSEPTILTESDEMQTAPSVVETADGWLLAWESVSMAEENVSGVDVRYTTVDANGDAGDVDAIADATLPTLGTADGDAILAYATLDEGPTANASAGESRTGSVVTERLVDGELEELSTFDAGNATSIATDAGRTVWVDGVFDPAVYEGDGDGVTALDLREDVRDVTELALATADDETVLSYRAMTDGKSANDLVYRLDRGDGWVADREHVSVGEANHTAWHADVTPAADGEGFHAAYAVQKLDTNATNDVFVADHEFRPAFDLSATTSEAPAGENATVSYGLRNVGDVATSEGVTVVVENATDVVAEVEHDALGAGENASGEVELEVDEYGAFDLRVDYPEETHDGVEETTVVAATAALSVDAISSERTAGGVEVTAVVENDGGAAAVDVPLTFDNGTDLVADAYADRVDPGENATVSTLVGDEGLNASVADRVSIDAGGVGEDAIDRGERPAWFAQPDLDVGTVEYVGEDGSVTAQVMVANRGTGSTDATVKIVADNGTVIGEATDHLGYASTESPTFASVPVELGEIETGTDVTILAEGDVPDADPSTAGISDEVGPVFDPDRPTFDVAIANVTEPDAAGDEFDVDVAVQNRGDEADEQSLVLYVDDEETDRVDVALEPGFETTETLSHLIEEVETPSVDLRVETETAHDAATLAAPSPADDTPSPGLPPAPTPDPAAFDVVEFDAPDEIVAGASLPVATTVQNTGEQSGTTTVALELDGRTIDEREIELDGADRETFEFEISAADLDIGEHELRLDVGDDAVTETVTVTEAETGTDDEPPADDSPGEPADDDSPADGAVDDRGDADDGIPGFGVLVALVAVLTIASIAARRTRS
ncbi:right-handed parallel beta-helix repeat-containing protein [Halovivax gelatinilyticus]|uniref:right-handed parallel beta-helix repeat-containing protein n=1 Tax=Halovivax gelatinilyticus TaxID=2961597 RepID=UPI0020CA48A6|nr:right-handed parallel beta-helix repeat-containing protein [Halovivax gelatinilyticus]